jgi:hypothetical protein
MLLSEIFDNSLNNIRINWAGDMGQFILGDYTYFINFMKMDQHDVIYATAPTGSPISNKTYFIGFAAMNNDTGEVSDEETNLGDSIKVFSVILNGLKQRVNETKANVLYFGNYEGSKKESLYRKLIKKYAVNGWSVHSEYSSRFNGQPIHVWILTNQ